MTDHSNDAPGATRPDATPEGRDAPSDFPRWRRIVAAVLVTVGVLLVPVSMSAIWVRRTLLDTDQYVATVGPLAEELRHPAWTRRPDHDGAVRRRPRREGDRRRASASGRRDRSPDRQRPRGRRERGGTQAVPERPVRDVVGEHEPSGAHCTRQGGDRRRTTRLHERRQRLGEPRTDLHQREAPLGHAWHHALRQRAAPREVPKRGPDAVEAARGGARSRQSAPEARVGVALLRPAVYRERHRAVARPATSDHAGRHLGRGRRRRPARAAQGRDGTSTSKRSPAPVPAEVRPAPSGTSSPRSSVSPRPP